MQINFSDFYKIDFSVFEATGALNPVLGFDTRLFIDPSLLKNTAVPELIRSYIKFQNHFINTFKIINKIKSKGDIFWKSADKMLTFPEVRGLCIGYSTSSTYGKGAGPKKRERLLDTCLQLVKAGSEDPTIFELVGTFEEDVGPDLIGDMTAKIIIHDLILYTQRICSDLGISLVESVYDKKNYLSALLPIDENNDPIILVPKEILRDLPIALDFSDISWIAAHNQKLRNELNLIIHARLVPSTTSEKKKLIKKWLIEEPLALKQLIQEYKKAPPELYDFESDPTGETSWYNVSKQTAANEHLNLKLPPNPTINDVYGIALSICEKFKSLIENNKLSSLLYDGNGKAKRESAAQLLFFGIASAFCESNNLDISPESNAGRGPVDFKISSGSLAKVVVELKLTSNPQLIHGFKKQLPIYKTSEHAQKGIYLVIDNGRGSITKISEFKSMVSNITKDDPLHVIMINASPQSSASAA